MRKFRTILINSLFFILLLILTVCISFGSALRGNSRNMIYYKLSVHPTIHENYGLSYPLTYIFQISESIEDGAKIFWTDEENATWTPLIEKNTTTLFNGLDCVRFDYTNHLAYISIRFTSEQDNLFLSLEDKNHRSQNMTYLSIARYYDNRSAAFVWSLDDFPENVGTVAENQSYYEFHRIAREHHIWVTTGVTTACCTEMDWKSLQEDIDQGYLEIASHSVNHPNTSPYQYPEAQVKQSKEAITSNLNLSEYYRKGSRQYVPCWIEPSGVVDDEIRSFLGKNFYLIDRSTQDNQSWIATWNQNCSLFERMGTTLSCQYQDELQSAISAFDKAYLNHNVIHFWGHPWMMLNPQKSGSLDIFKSGSWFDSLLDYVSDRKDIWYVGFGALYMYQLPLQRSLIAVSSGITIFQLGSDIIYSVLLLDLVCMISILVLNRKKSQI